jgi:hypothetical protein
MEWGMEMDIQPPHVHRDREDRGVRGEEPVEYLHDNREGSDHHSFGTES